MGFSTKTLKNEFLSIQCQKANSLDGDVVEVGVYRGHSADIITSAMPNKTVHLFDTFTGIPEVTERLDLHKLGSFSDTSLELVQDRLAGRNVIFYPGFFPDTAKGFDKKLCLVHVDVDSYLTTKRVIELFWPLLVRKGIMVFDDYHARLCPGVNKIVDEKFGNRVESFDREKAKSSDVPYGTRVVKRT